MALVLPADKVPPEVVEQLGLQVYQEPSETQDSMDHLDSQVLVVLQDPLDPKDPLVLRDL